MGLPRLAGERRAGQLFERWTFPNVTSTPTSTPCCLVRNLFHCEFCFSTDSLIFRGNCQRTGNSGGLIGGKAVTSHDTGQPHPRGGGPPRISNSSSDSGAQGSVSSQLLPAHCASRMEWMNAAVFFRRSFLSSNLGSPWRWLARL